MEERDRMRDQGSPDRQPNKPKPGQEGDSPSDPRRTREGEDDRDTERQAPRREPGSNESPKTA